MSVVDDLRYRSDQARQDAARWRSDIAELERSIESLRRKIEVAVLDEVESMVTANIIEQAGLTVEMRDGAPYVHVDRVLADPPVSPLEMRQLGAFRDGITERPPSPPPDRG